MIRLTEIAYGAIVWIASKPTLSQHHCDEVINFCVIGTSYINHHALCNPIARLPQCQIKTVISSKESSAQAFQKKYGASNYYFGDYLECIEKLEGVDCVYISIKTEAHVRITRACLERGFHVLCEKPLSLTLNGAQSLGSLAKEKGVVLVEAFHYKFHPLYARILSLLRRREELGLGNMTSIFSEASSFSFTAWREGSQEASASSLANLYNLFCYPLDFTRTILEHYLSSSELQYQIEKTKVEKYEMSATLSIKDEDRNINWRVISRRNKLSLLNHHLRINFDNGYIDVDNYNTPFLYHKVVLNVNKNIEVIEIKNARSKSTFDYQLEYFVKKLSSQPEEEAIASNYINALRNATLLQSILAHANVVVIDG